MKRNDGTALFLRRKRAVPCFRSWTAGFLYRVSGLKVDGLGKFVAVSPDRRATGSGVVPMPVPCRPGGAACIRYTGGVRKSLGCGAGGAFRSVRTNAQTLRSCPQNVGRRNRQTLRSRILPRRVFRRVLSDIIKSLARRWRRRWTVGSRMGYADGCRNDPEQPAKRLKPEEERAGLGCAVGCLCDVSSVAATALRGGEIQRAPASRTGGTPCTTVFAAGRVFVSEPKTVRVRRPDALRSLYRRVFAGTFPEPERAVAGSPGTRGRPNFQKKKVLEDLLSSDASRIGLARSRISYSVSRNRLPRRFLRWQDAPVPMLRSVALAILSSGIFSQKAFRPLVPNGFRVRGPNASRSLCRRVFAVTFPEPERAVAGKLGTRGRPNFQKKKASEDLLSSDASRIGLARCPISYSVSRNRVPRRFLRWQDALVPMLRSVSLAILSSGVFCKRHFDRLCRMGFARGAMVSALQRVFRKRMPRHRRYRLPRTILFGKRVPFPIFSRKAF